MEVDVLIVGAGPAGCAAALALADTPRGLDGVVVLEAARHPRDKPCGGVVAPRALPLLQRWLPDPGAFPVQRVRHLAVRRDGLVQVRPLPRIAWAVHRPSFDAALAAAVRARGDLREGHRLVSLRMVAGGHEAIIAGPSGRCTWWARHVVGADGAHSRVRRFTAGASDGPRAALALADRPVGPHDPPADTVVFEVPSAPDLPGYLWNFPAPRPDGAPTRNVGAFVAGGRAGVARDVVRARLEVGGHGSVRVRTAVQRLWSRKEPAPEPGAWLAGESQGADPITGEGIAHAVLQGAWVARALRGASAPLDTRALDQSAGAQRWIFGAWRQVLASRLLRAPALIDLVVGRFCGVRSTPVKRRLAGVQLLVGTWPPTRPCGSVDES